MTSKRIIPLLLTLFAIFACKPEPFLTLEFTERTVSEAGEVFSVDVRSSSDWNVASVDVQNWCSASKTADGTATISVSRNTSGDIRTATYCFSCDGAMEQLVATQSQNDVILAEKTFCSFGPEGGVFSVGAWANIEFSCSSDEDWIKILGQNSSKGMEKKEISFEIAPNKAASTRTGHLRIEGRGAEASVEIFQEALEILFLDTESVSFDAGANEYEIRATSNMPVRVYSSGSWLTAKSIDLEDGAIICLSTQPNYSVKARTAEVKVLGENLVCAVKVKQEGYTSTDYSQDRAVTVWQRTDTGRGGNFVVIGDGFSDRMIANGTYESVMKKAVEAIFAQEPYASLRNMLNIYSVTAVSPNEGIGNGGKTALGCYFYGDRMAYGDEKKSIEYALEAVDEAVLDETVVVVVMNSTKYGGIADWFPPTTANDYGDGLCVAFFAMYTDNQTFVDLVQHEACGHGFAKLADEYDYYYPGENNVADYNQISREYNEMASIGWYKNVDYRSNPSLVKWSRFIGDERYRAQKIGVYEGAGYYVKGAYRPTENSLMRTLGVDYNAPSREAIYYRINKLYYGDDWEYDYEAFVQQDLKNSSAGAAPMTCPGTAVERHFETVPPRNMGVTWREFLGR